MKSRDVIALSSVVGAIVGCVSSFIYTEVKKKGTEKINLGYDWNFIVLDEGLCKNIALLKEFEHAAPECYKEVGSACDLLIQLHCMLMDSNIEVDALWTIKTYTYKEKIDKNLNLLARAVQKVHQPPIVIQRVNGVDLLQKRTVTLNTNMEQFGECADAIVLTVENYEMDIKMTIPMKLMEQSTNNTLLYDL